MALGAAETGSDAQPNLRHAEGCLFTGYPNVAGHGQLTAAAQGEAVDCGDHRAGEAGDVHHGIVSMMAEALGVVGGIVDHLADVGTGHEGASGAGDNDDVDILLGFCAQQDIVQLFDDLQVQGVQDFRAVDGDEAHVAALLKFYKSHRGILLFTVSHSSSRKSRG